MFVTFCLNSNLLLAKGGIVTGSVRLRKAKRRGRQSYRRKGGKPEEEEGGQRKAGLAMGLGKGERRQGNRGRQAQK